VNIEVRAPARPALNPFYRPEHEAFRETVRRFVKKEIEPFATQWDEAEEFPRRGSEEMTRRVLPQILSGEKISALAITESGGGSDVARLQTSARRDGDDYVVNGQKTFITSGMRADYYTVAVRTGGLGAAGVSLLLIERDRPGFSRTPLMMG
jgi:alkylation response protein AidB-like acyl-CoA dehydrogenase